MAWFGAKSELMSVLHTIRAERDTSGRVILTGAAPIVGLDGGVVVPDECRCIIRGQPVGICAVLNATSYGLREVSVISG